MKENNGKLKKMEASLIKRLLRISWQVFCSVFIQCSFGAFIILSLSHTLGYLDSSWSTFGECGYLVIWSKKEMEEQESIRGHQDQHLQRVLIVGTELHICFPRQFWQAWCMHVDFPSLSISQIVTPIFGHLTYYYQMDQSAPCKTNFTLSKIAFTMKNNLVILNLLTCLWPKQETL